MSRNEQVSNYVVNEANERLVWASVLTSMCRSQSPLSESFGGALNNNRTASTVLVLYTEDMFSESVLHLNEEWTTVKDVRKDLV